MSALPHIDNDYVTEYIHVDKIYPDESFNCRGIIQVFDVADLAKDIQRNKLQFPIAVQPSEDLQNQLPEGKEYRIVAGHRRFKAWMVLHSSWKPGELAAGDLPWDDANGNPYEMIPCMVKTGLNEVQARILNLGENLKRKDLNILQEALAIQHLHDAGVPREHVAEELGMSSGWVQTRYQLLSLPEEIQQECATGLVNQAQIKQLYTIRNDKEKQFEAVRKIKEARMKGEKISHVGVRKKSKTTVKKERRRVELFAMIEFLAKAIGYGLHTRNLSWAAGEISTQELFDDIKDYCQRTDRPIPHFPEEF